MADIKNTYGTGLVEHWKFEETSGNRTGSFASTVLTDVNTVASATGKQGTGADFEGSNSEYFYVASDLSLSSTSDMSISFWFKLESTSGAQTFFFYNNDNASSDFQVYCDLNQGGTNFIRAVCFPENVSGYTWSGIDTNWHHLVWTFKYNTASIGQNLYLDASLIASSSTSAAGVGTIENKLYIGASQDPSRYLDGVMDEFTIWSRELSSSEVSGIYNSGNGIEYESPLEVSNTNSYVWGVKVV
jgi:hypothetical protein